MTGVLDQLTQLLQTLFLGPRNWVFVSAIGLSIIAGMLLKRGFKKEVKVEEAAPGTPTAEDYLSEHRQAEPQGREEAETQTATQTSSPPTPIDPELTRRLDAIEEALMRLSAKSDKTAIEPLLRLSERKIPVQISGTIDGEFDIPISSLRNVRIGVKQVKGEKAAEAPAIAETPPTEGD